MELNTCAIFYSKYSSFSKNLLDLINSSSIKLSEIYPIKYVCLDNEDIRDRVIKDNVLNLKYVPTIILIYNNSNIEKYEGITSIEWIQEIINKNLEYQSLLEKKTFEEDRKNELNRLYLEKIKLEQLLKNKENHIDDDINDDINDDIEDNHTIDDNIEVTDNITPILDLENIEENVEENIEENVEEKINEKNETKNNEENKENFSNDKKLLPKDKPIRKLKKRVKFNQNHEDRFNPPPNKPNKLIESSNNINQIKKQTGPATTKNDIMSIAQNLAKMREENDENINHSKRFMERRV